MVETGRVAAPPRHATGYLQSAATQNRSGMVVRQGFRSPGLRPGGRTVGVSPDVQSNPRHPGIAPAISGISRTWQQRWSGLEIPDLRCAAAGMTEV